MICQICKFTDEVQSGDVLDVVKLYHAFKDRKSKEADPKFVIAITYSTNELRRFLKAAAKLGSQRNEGLFIASSYIALPALRVATR